MMMSWLFSLQWMGSASGFAPAESMPDHVILTKYNALVHRAQHQKQAKVHVHAHHLNSMDVVLVVPFPILCFSLLPSLSFSLYLFPSGSPSLLPLSHLLSPSLLLSVLQK